MAVNEYFPRGGQISDQYGLSANLYLEDAADLSTVKEGTPLTLTGANAYEVRVSGAADTVHAKAKVSPNPVSRGVGAHVFGYTRIERLPYTGTAPALGGTVSPDGAGGWTATAVDGTNGIGYVVSVDEGNEKFEVLL
jgi:hypothetical protein